MLFNIDNYVGDYIMCCKSEEEAKNFCLYLHNHGREWFSNASYYDHTYWNSKYNCIYYIFNKGFYNPNKLDKDYEHYKVLYYSDYIWEEDKNKMIFNIKDYKDKEYAMSFANRKELIKFSYFLDANDMKEIGNSPFNVSTWHINLDSNYKKIYFNQGKGKVQTEENCTENEFELNYSQFYMFIGEKAIMVDNGNDCDAIIYSKDNTWNKSFEDTFREEKARCNEIENRISELEKQIAELKSQLASGQNVKIKKTFNLEDFISSKKGLCCETKEESDKFREYLDKHNKRWASEEPYLAFDCWGKYPDFICYFPYEGTYASLKYSKEMGYEIHYYKDYDWD